MLIGTLIVLAVAVSAQRSQKEFDDLGWKNLPASLGGFDARPYVESFSVENNGVTTTIWSGLTSPATSPPSQSAGSPTITLDPLNMCGLYSGGMCYPIPNRIGFNVLCYAGAGRALSSTLSDCGITQNTKVSMTINMNKFGKNSSWIWMNGAFQYYRRLGDGQPGNNLRIALTASPRTYPMVTSFPSPNCCTCTWPNNCPLQNTQDELLSLHGIVSVEYENEDMTGCIFSSTHAIHAAMGSELNGMEAKLKYKLSGAHFAKDGSLNRGNMVAFVPDKVVAKMWHQVAVNYQNSSAQLSEAEEREVNATIKKMRMRRDVTVEAAATGDVVTYESVGVNQIGTKGLLISVSNVSFSTPEFQLTTAGVASLHLTSVLLVVVALLLLA